MLTKGTAPIVLPKNNEINSQFAVDNVPFSPPADGLVDFSKLLNYKRNEFIREETPKNDALLQVPNQNQYLRISLLRKNNSFTFDKVDSNANQIHSISLPATASSTPCQTRKQNTDFMNKMFEYGFQNSSSSTNSLNSNDYNKTLNEYRQLNTIVPDSL